jgi:hypothetical protein
MKFGVASGVKLTTFAGVNVEPFGFVNVDGVLDAQYVEVLGGTLSGDGSIRTGSGPIVGQVENRNGTVAPGSNVGVMSIAGRFANGRDGTLRIELVGTTAGSQYDQLLVDGPVTLDGILSVLLPNHGSGVFEPNLGNAFSIITADSISGEFATLNLPALAAGRVWLVDYAETEVALKVTFPGDFDGDFAVDEDDLAVWKEGFGTKFSGADFLNWQRFLGSSVNPIAAVPEPCAVLLAAIALAGVAVRRRAGESLTRG